MREPGTGDGEREQGTGREGKRGWGIVVVEFYKYFIDIR